MALRSASISMPVPTPYGSMDETARQRRYGGMVGQMIDDIDLRIAAQEDFAAPPVIPEDFLHQISITCGYVGLIAGFAGAYATLCYLI